MCVGIDSIYSHISIYVGVNVVLLYMYMHICIYCDDEDWAYENTHIQYKSTHNAVLPREINDEAGDVTVEQRRVIRSTECVQCVIR